MEEGCGGESSPFWVHWTPNPLQAFASQFLMGFDAVSHPVRGLKRCRLAPVCAQN